MNVQLKKFNYKHMEYEKELCLKEIAVIFPEAVIEEKKDYIELFNVNITSPEYFDRLTYIESYCIDGQWRDTLQKRLEEDDMLHVCKQHTRYSTHGIHEYKGKFNPQIVRAIVNCIGVKEGDMLLDPFNGSGTTILECAHMGINAIGTDINPMACYIANAKIKSLSINIVEAREALEKLIMQLSSKVILNETDDVRLQYLKKWIPEKELAQLEYLRMFFDEYETNIKTFYSVIASDLIRDYSYQEPSDLRIRRRISAFPDVEFTDAFYTNSMKQLHRIEKVQQLLPDIISSKNEAILCDIKKNPPKKGVVFDAAITSPPYATALPYIDTQRISLVWLGLCFPSNINTLEASLIGSREVIRTEKQKWESSFINNNENLPKTIYDLVNTMAESLDEKDGFRKKAVPLLMYRYFSEMKEMFKNISQYIKSNGICALVVGHNQTTLGGKKFFVNTPAFLVELAEYCGWESKEIIPLQTYKRYGINSKNSINQESLIILKNK